MRRSSGLSRSTKHSPASAFSQVASLSNLVISRGVMVRKTSSHNLCSSALKFTGRRSSSNRQILRSSLDSVSQVSSSEAELLELAFTADESVKLFMISHLSVSAACLVAAPEKAQAKHLLRNEAVGCTFVQCGHSRAQPGRPSDPSWEESNGHRLHCQRKGGKNG